MSGANRSPRHLCPDISQYGGDFFTQKQTKLPDWGAGVYVQHGANQTPDGVLKGAKERIKQPSSYIEKYIDNDNETLVTEFGYKEFVWWSDCLTGGLPPLYKQVLEELGVFKSEYNFELLGFNYYLHKEDKSRRCSVESIYLPQIRCGKYHPYASVKHKRRASMRTLERLESLEKKLKKLSKKWERDWKKRWKHRFDYLVCLDLTLPKYVSLKWYDEETQIDIRKALQLFLELLHDILFPEYNSQFGLICNNHFWRTMRPLEAHRHVHLTAPNVCYNKSENKFYRFAPYLTKEKLKELKKCWKKALVEQDLWFEEEDGDDEEEKLPDCRLGYIKFSDRDKVINRLAYCCRRPCEDMIEYLEPEDLEFFDDSKEFAGFLIDYTPRVVNLGFLTNLKRFGCYSNKTKCMICPICGGEMYALTLKEGLIGSLDRPPPGPKFAPKLLQDRKGIWYALSE